MGIFWKGHQIVQQTYEKMLKVPTLNQCFILSSGKFKGSAYPRSHCWFATEIKVEPRKLDTSCPWTQKTLLFPVPLPGDWDQLVMGKWRRAAVTITAESAWGWMAQPCSPPAPHTKISFYVAWLLGKKRSYKEMGEVVRFFFFFFKSPSIDAFGESLDTQILKYFVKFPCGAYTTLGTDFNKRRYKGISDTSRKLITMATMLVWKL